MEFSEEPRPNIIVVWEVYCDCQVMFPESYLNEKFTTDTRRQTDALSRHKSISQKLFFLQTSKTLNGTHYSVSEQLSDTRGEGGGLYTVVNRYTYYNHILYASFMSVRKSTKSNKRSVVTRASTAMSIQSLNTTVKESMQ